jgi:hypothetical protein
MTSSSFYKLGAYAAFEKVGLNMIGPGMGIGALGYGALGAGMGALADSEDRGRGALYGGLGGAALGTGLGALGGHHMNKAFKQMDLDDAAATAARKAPGAAASVAPPPMSSALDEAISDALSSPRASDEAVLEALGGATAKAPPVGPVDSVMGAKPRVGEAPPAQGNNVVNVLDWAKMKKPKPGDLN